MATISLSRKIGDTIYCGCPPCEVVFSNLDAVIAIFASCGCIAFPDDAPPTSLKIDHVTGITGAFSASIGSTIIGDAYIQAYAGGDLTCSSPVGAPQLNSVLLDITCFGGRLFPRIDIVGFGPLFINTSGGLIGETIDNELNCGSTPPPGQGIFGIVGSVQLFLP